MTCVLSNHNPRAAVSNYSVMRFNDLSFTTPSSARRHERVRPKLQQKTVTAIYHWNFYVKRRV